MADRPTHAIAQRKLKEILSHSGIRATIIFLNSLTNHRFTSLYRFDGGTLKNLHFFDRENPSVTSSPEIPVLASYCVFVRDSGQLFSFENSLEDKRTVGHSKRLEVRAYCGVPLLDRDGKMFGTVCHFDLDPKPIHPEDVVLMEALAEMLQGEL
jgi:GAF domain-containing protein